MFSERLLLKNHRRPGWKQMDVVCLNDDYVLIKARITHPTNEVMCDCQQVVSILVLFAIYILNLHYTYKLKLSVEGRRFLTNRNNSIK